MSSDESLYLKSFEKNDIENVLDILQNLSEKNKNFFHPHDFDLETLNENINSDDHYYVLTHDNDIIGYSLLRLFGYEVPSFGCCIKNGFENKGYGTLITKMTIEKAKELGYNKVILKTYKENVSAQKIYKKLGFKKIGETKDKKQYKMELNLDNK